MASRSFILTLKTSLSGSGTGTATYQVPVGQRLTLRKLVVSATGAFNITDIRKGSGQDLTNASVNEPIPSAVLANGGDGYNGLKELDPPIVVESGESIKFDLLDTSTAANTVYLVFVGELEVGA